MSEEERLREILKRLALYAYPLADNLGDICEDIERACKLAKIDLPEEWYEGPTAWQENYDEEAEWPSLHDDDLK